MTEQLTDFQTVADALQHAHARTNAAETHGMLCGFISAGKMMDGKSWIEPILGEYKTDDKGKADRQVLLDLYQHSANKLQAMEFDFQLLLPDDEEQLQLRAEALSHWCQGYLMGLNLAGIDIYQGVSNDSKEALHHFQEIAKLDYDAIEINQDDERAYYEVMEYVRMAVLMLFNEFHIASQTSDGPTSQKQLH